ncbi:DUF4175 domain-containing protein [Alicyclobacillus fastidiosus]|uniref:DUF4175 domain-containing protein n=1 Tax=Alicyclobacillus fastidiosus TaxID=392011 RepID=A0ABY6ZDX5_9BACL|nr:hypothetical protein [Alicyclobacillus fastidiosus]WAH40930.1 DUF4175 domain-containing protein [Alicyclobacillus fastidiosus]GMA62433.1 hypothetical protein GCM10025859_28730 [Alicyclobacillus fastidiosus]
MQQQYPGNQQFGASGQLQGGYNTLRQFGTDPQQVRQHISESLNQGSMQQYGGQGSGGVMQAGATDPRVVQQHIAQDLGYGASASYGGQQYNQGAFQQVMQSAPAQVQGGQGQQLGQFQGGYNQGYSNSTFGQFGTNPQVVRQHIQQDLSNQVGSMTSEQAGAYRGQFGGGAQGMMSQGQMSQGQMSQGQGMNSTFSQFGTNPQEVRQHIQQDLSNQAGSQAGFYGGAQGMMSQGQMSQGQMSQGQGMNSTFGQFGTNPQEVRQHIQQDLSNQAGSQAGFYGGAQGMASQGQMSQGQGMNSTFGQFGTNPQEVRQHIQQDLSNQAGSQAGFYGGAQGMASQGQAMNSTFGQFGTDPQTVRSHISQDLNNLQ